MFELCHKALSYLFCAQEMSDDCSLDVIDGSIEVDHGSAGLGNSSMIPASGSLEPSIASSSSSKRI